MGSFSKFTFLVGVFILIIGAVLLLNNLGITDISTNMVFSNFWPILLIVWGLDILFRDCKKVPRFSLNNLFGLVILILGTMLLGENLDLIDFDLSRFWKFFWPALLILIGLNILRGALGTKSSSFAIMSALENKKEGWQLEDKSYLALMGGIDLDLTVADIPDREVYIDITAIMGGVDIKAPEDLDVVCYSSAFLGGVDFYHEEMGGILAGKKFEHKGSVNSRKKVVIRCRTIMGGISIKNAE